MPWEQNTLNGYMTEQFFSALYIGSYDVIVTALLTYFVSICNYHRAFYEMFQIQIDNINAEIDTRPFSIDRIKNLMHESITYHISCKE